MKGVIEYEGLKEEDEDFVWKEKMKVIKRR